MSTIAPVYAYAPSYAAAPQNNATPLLNRALAKSQSGAWLLGQFSRYGMPNVVVTNGSALSPNENGKYNRPTNTVYLRASLLKSNPQQAVATYGHELFHALDQRRGTINSTYATYDKTTSKLVLESRAYAFQAQVTHELGYSRPTGKAARGAYDQASPQQAYLGAWYAISARDGLPSRSPVYAPGWQTPY